MYSDPFVNTKSNFMKKILSLLTMMAVFCMVGFAQSAPVTAKKAMLMGNNAQVKDAKTGQVQRVAKATKPVPAINGTIQMSGKGINTPSNSTATPSNGNSFKTIKDAKPCNNELKVKEVTQTQTSTQTGAKSSDTSMKNMKAIEDNLNSMLKTKEGSVVKKQTKTLGKKQHKVLPKGAIMLEKQ